MCVRARCKLCADDMILSTKLIVTIVFSVFLVGACQPLPRPFQPIVKAADSMPPELEAKFGLFLAGIDNAPAVFESNFIRILGEELTSRDVVSSRVVANQGSYLLVGEFSETPTDSIHLLWRIVAADGVVIGLFDQVGATDEANLAKLAQDAANRIAMLMKAADPPRAKSRTFTFPTVVLHPVDGAPGDGRISLTSAMRAALGRRSIRVLDDSHDGALVVLGSVKTSIRGDGQLVEVHWSVINEVGRELGSVTQSNVVPVGMLDGSWGEIAHAVADGGAAGVIALLREAHRSRSSVRLD